MTEPTADILRAARLVAQGDDLETKLAALSDFASAAAGGSFARIHLLDEVGRWLVPATGGAEAASQGIDMEAAPVALTTALTERRPQTLDPTAAAGLLALPPGTAEVVILPLVSSTNQGGVEIDGALFVALGDAPPGADALPHLVAISDFAAVAVRLTRLENALTERADWLERVASTDPLTGLANRHTFERMLQLEVVRAGRQGAAVGLALISVDGLAGIRDRSGEGEADGLLRRVAATLAEQLRLVDTVARIGPDTFAAICPGSPGPEAALRVRDAVAGLEPASADPTTPPAGRVSVSVGVSRFPEDGTDAETLLAAAEAAVERARAQGPGSVVAPAAVS